MYTGGTLQLRPVKLLFVIFGRLSYYFFMNLRVSGNGRLSYLGGSNGLYYDFSPIRLTKACIYNFRETYFRKNERSKQ